MTGFSSIQDLLMVSVLSRFDTGSPTINALIMPLFILISSNLTNIWQQLNVIVQKVQNFFYGKKTVNRIIISGKKTEHCYGWFVDYSETFRALRYRIQKLNCTQSKIFELKEMSEYSWKGTKDDANLVVCQSTPFLLDENVIGTITMNKNQNSIEKSKDSVSMEEISITISSTVLSMDELRERIRMMIKEYKKSLSPDEHLRYFLYNVSEEVTNDGKKTGSSNRYSEFRFETGKSFENLFFPQKDKVLSRLNFFRDNKEWYKERGIPYTFGMMLYGEPGCGKTSTIKAIANHTQRHIVSVPLGKIETYKELLDVFYNQTINNMEIPLEKRLYVIEDIDCTELKDIVKERGKDSDKNSPAKSEKSATETSTDTNIDTVELVKLITTTKEPEGPLSFKKWKNNKITLAIILEVLDGVMEMAGRMLVITTNYPERLDSALTRAGRVDMKIKFERCTRQSLFEMYKHFFQDRKSLDIWPENFDIQGLPDHHWTPAEATQVFLDNIDDPRKAISQLKNSGSLLIGSEV